jgi:hypothetical protein
MKTINRIRHIKPKFSRIIERKIIFKKTRKTRGKI